MLHEGQEVELTIEKPAAGGQMIARHHGQVVLVRGAIPGERVRALVERAEKRLAYAVTRTIVEASADRRTPSADPLCGGNLYGYIAYPRQLALKRDIISDAFARLGRLPLDASIDVAGSPERAYRMRARCHVRGPRAGFYREGTHQLCDPAVTGQLLPESAAALQRIAASMDRDAPGAALSIELAENIAGDQRSMHLELAPGARIDAAALARIGREAAVAGITALGTATGRLLEWGDPVIADPLEAVTGGRVTAGDLRRQPASFFQGNRFLVATLVTAMMDAVPAEGEILDLYAGVGVFAVALAAAGHLEVTAVEGDRTSGTDLRRNATPYAPRLAAHVQRVEDYLASRSGAAAGCILVDPPRTGLSKEAADAIVHHAAPRIVYVSCDAPTLARDARRLVDTGYRLSAIRAFDLFPNTPHVETLAVFDRVSR
jgi:tRNA/tmRNA/rRNA uracil-C5-methylase (TrmA/RlmC/RlmD family)